MYIHICTKNNMEKEEDTTNILLKTIRKELASIIEDGSENIPKNSKEDTNKEPFGEVKPFQNIDSSTICSTSISDCMQRSASKDDNFSRSTILDNINISAIDNDIHKLQCSLDESCKLFQSIGERFENINVACLKNRIKDLHFNERSSNAIKIIVNDLKHSFDEKYMENRLNELTKEISSKFRNHPGEFGDIPEISEFFRTCTKLEQGLGNLRKQKDDYMYLQKRMTRIAEASYEHVKTIQQKINDKEDSKHDNI